MTLLTAQVQQKDFQLTPFHKLNQTYGKINYLDWAASQVNVEELFKSKNTYESRISSMNTELRLHDFGFGVFGAVTLAASLKYTNFYAGLGAACVASYAFLQSLCLQDSIEKLNATFPRDFSLRTLYLAEFSNIESTEEVDELESDSSSANVLKPNCSISVATGNGDNENEKIVALKRSLEITDEIAKNALPLVAVYRTWANIVEAFEESIKQAEGEKREVLVQIRAIALVNQAFLGAVLKRPASFDRRPQVYFNIISEDGTLYLKTRTSEIDLSREPRIMDLVAAITP